MPTNSPLPLRSRFNSRSSPRIATHHNYHSIHQTNQTNQTKPTKEPKQTPKTKKKKIKTKTCKVDSLRVALRRALLLSAGGW
jgi:hypothetical protein